MRCGSYFRGRLPILVLAVVCSAALVHGQDNFSEDAQDATNSVGNPELANSSHVDPQVEIPVPRWSQGPKRHDFSWSVKVLPPTLTFQQRQLVTIEATFRAGDLRKAGLANDLYFVLKVADEDGTWLPGSSVGRFEMPPKVASHDHVRALFGMYIEPGTYKASLMAFDNRTNKGNLWYGTVQVRPIYRDPLPGGEQHFPAVEFLPASPPFASGLGWMMTHDPWEFGQNTLTIPVGNETPLEVDVVANLSLSDTANSRHSQAPDWMYQINAATVTEISRVLAEMNLKSGCIRLTALDIPRQEFFADREYTHNFDWSRIRRAMEARQRSKIDVHVLAAEKKTPSFLSTYLSLLANDPPACTTPDGGPPVRVLILISDAFSFPYGTEMVRARPSNAWTRCYYMELVPEVGPHWDQINNVLKPLNPVRVEVSTPAGFRRVLGQLVHALEKAAGKPDSPPSAH